MKTWNATPKLMVSIVVCNNNISIFIVIIVIIFMLFIWRIFVLSITKTIQKWCQNKGFQPLPLGCPPSQKWMNFWGEKTKGGRLNFWCKKSFQILHIIDRNIGHEFATKNSEKKARGWISCLFSSPAVQLEAGNGPISSPENWCSVSTAHTPRVDPNLTLREGTGQWKWRKTQEKYQALVTYWCISAD